ncbi:type VI secretion system-associated protein TagO [Kaistia nematophila]|uniref:Type VI secretion system-associated protein TagO n=1 Tax=Kaistia nematophila TaxID=2994654 RepID=A0A9X3ILK2_9HYPH|nr:type VI secretion system-associated protein TagO [Kaistia nematophila]MCX5569631.1 type VI secretion system-associated protein TagO [Kaistia nematophila]
MVDDGQRLACFDRAADADPGVNSANQKLSVEAGTSKPTIVPPPSKTDTKAGVWEIGRQRSEIAGTDDVFLSVWGTPYRGRYGKNVVPVLWVRCHEKKTGVMVVWGSYLGLDETRVEWRIDEGGRSTGSWRISSDREAVGLWTGASAIPFIRTLLGKNRIAMRVIPYGEDPAETVFPITGLDKQIGEVKSACGWK